MKTNRLLIVFAVLALLPSAPAVRAQTNLANALDATDLVWTTGGTGGVGWYYAAGALGDNTFDGLDSAHSGAIGNNGETWVQTTVVGPGTVSFWWQAYSEPNADWLEFYVSSDLQARICGGGDDWSSWPSGWQYCSFPVPAGTNVLTWRYVKDYQFTGGTLDYGQVDQVSYVTSPPPPLEQALNTSGVLWSSSGSIYDNSWFGQTNVTHDGQWAAQSGAIWHNQTNWLEATVSGVTNFSFWWKVSSEAGHDFLELYTNGVLARQISGEVNWQSNYFRLPVTTNILTWRYRRDAWGTAGSNCGWLDEVVFSTPINKADTSTAVAASDNPSVFGQAVTFTATVTVVAPGSGTPTGTVTFKDGATTLGTSGVSAGQATFTTASLAAASHSITATYNGDPFFKTSAASPLTQTVNQASTTTTVAASVNPSVFGQSVSFTATVNAVAPGAGTLTGTVQFSMDGSAFGSPVSLSGGTATSAAISSLSAAGHTVTAVYSGDTSFAGSGNASSPLTQTVNAASTTTTVASSANPAVFGQPVTFTATVAAVLPGSGTPSGTVTFKDGAATLGTGTLSAGLATFSTSALSVAAHPITAVYGGDSSYSPSTSSTLTQTVNKDGTITTLASSANPSVFSQSVTFTANITANSPGSGTPTGTATFKDGATALATTTLSSGQATFTTSTLSIAAHSITAVYNGDANFTTSANSPALTQTVNRDSTTVTLSASTNPIVFGQAVIFTASVAAVPPGSGTPAGTVTFKDGATALVTNTLVSGQASCTNAAFSAGAHLVSAVYNGDANFNTNTSLVVTQTVNQASTATTVAASANPSVFGQPVTFTATVSAVAPGAGTRTGTVQFSIDGSAFGSPVPLSGGTATSSAISSLAVAGHAVTAVYSGDSNFTGSDNSASPLTQTVNPANSTTAVSSSANPAVFGQSVTFTATVSAVAPGAGAGTGTVQFSIDGSAFGSPVSLSGGSATSGAISTLSVAGHTVTAAYSGDANFNASDTTAAPLIQTVNKASTTTTVAASANPAVAGQPVIFTATVSASAPGAGTPGGTVTFKDGATTLGTATLSLGQAAWSTATLSVAAHSITVVYNGDSNFSTSTSAPLSQTVNKADSSTLVTSSVNPAAFGQPVTFSATVTAVSPGVGTLTGTVQFKTNGVNFGSAVALSGGNGSSAAVASLAAGSCAVTAVYNGDTGFNSSTGTLSGGQTVNKANSSTAVSAPVNPAAFGQPVTFSAMVTAVSPGAGTPTGTVQFKTNGVNFGSAVTLSGGSASSSAISSLAVGNYTVTADYSGDSGFHASTSPLAGGQTVNQANSSAVVTSSANPSVFGQSVTFTATLTAVAPGTGTPGGTVQFKTNGVNFGSAVALSGGSASSGAILSLAVGSHTVTADYSGDSGFNGSSGTLAGGQTVNKANTSTAVSSSVAPSAFGQPVAFSATVTAVSPGAGMPTGTVQFKTNGVNFGSAVMLSGGSANSAAISSLVAGSYTVTADYGGDGSFNTSSGTLAGGQTVDKANSSTVVSSSVNPSAFGQPVTFSATVTAVSPGAGTPTGTVQFKTNGVNFGNAVTLAGGSASSPVVSSLAAGATTVTVVYSGDAGFNTSTSASLTQTVNKADTSMAVTAAGNPSVFGQAVTFTATLTAVAPGAGTPTGTVQFKTNGVNCGSAVTLSGGSATSSAISTLPVGNNTVTAVYNGDAGFNTSTGMLAGSQTVNQANSSTAVSSSANPSVWGQGMAFTATVTAVSPGTGTPTGTVQFQTNGVNFGSAVTLAGGSANSPALPSLAVGTATVSAIYSGGSNFNSSDNTATPLTQTVNKASTATTIASSKNPSSIGDPVTWTATVSASAPGAGTPSGTVRFKIDGTDFDGPVTLSGTSGTSIEISTLAPGSHTISAVYSGDGNFNTNTSANFTQTVNPSPVTPATGGNAISADTTSGAYTTLTGPVYVEPSLGAVGAGTIILNAPAGFMFDTGGTAPKVKITGGTSSAKNINDAVSGTALAMSSVTTTQLTFTVTASSSGGGTPNTLTWQDVRVRPMAGTPLAAGNITKAGNSAMSGVVNGANFGFLAETAGAASKLAVQTPPSATATAGLAFPQQPVVQIQDQFGNARTFANRNVDNSTVITAARGTGTATLQGTLTATAINGLATFSDLSYNKAETITIQFSSGGLASATSGNVVVSPAAADRLVFATQPGSANYGSALSPQPVVKARDPFGNDSTVGLPANQLVTLSLSAGTGLLQGTTSLDIGTSAGNGTVTFSDLQVSAAGTGKQLTAAATGLASAVSSSFAINPATVTATIHELAQQPDGNMEVRASGTAGATYLIQAGTNLTAWETIGTSTADPDGIILFLDQNATNYPSRFYRLATP